MLINLDQFKALNRVKRFLRFLLQPDSSRTFATGYANPGAINDARSNLFILLRGKGLFLHIYPLILTFNISTPVCRAELWKTPFKLLRGYKSPVEHHDICYLHLSEDSLGENIKIHWIILRSHFLNVNGRFCKEDQKAFLALRTIHSHDREVNHLFWNECSSYSECQHVRKYLSCMTSGISNISGAMRDDLNKELGLTKGDDRCLSSWVPAMKYLNSDEASLTWLGVRYDTC